MRFFFNYFLFFFFFFHYILDWFIIFTPLRISITWSKFYSIIYTNQIKPSNISISLIVSELISVKKMGVSLTNKNRVYYWNSFFFLIEMHSNNFIILAVVCIVSIVILEQYVLVPVFVTPVKDQVKEFNKTRFRQQIACSFSFFSFRYRL